MRLRELDFLRGVAVVLVIFSHSQAIKFFNKGGWIGVDLFFVLSGFLVSGLLFVEYKKFGNINGGLFLIRRGFKIYPLFYFTLALAILSEIFIKDRMPKYYMVVSELFFLQSYIKSILSVTWSLAVEEHFYFGLTLFVFLAVKFNWLHDTRRIVIVSFLIFITCLGLRISNYDRIPFRDLTHHFPTHLRIDSLLFGVLIAYFYHFKRSVLSFISTKKIVFYPLSIGLLSVSFLMERQSFFMVTFGFTFLYLGFGLLLILFVLDERINERLNRFLNAKVVNGMSKIGVYSYGIYLWHMMVILYIIPLFSNRGWLQEGSFTEFMVYFFLSILLGSMLSILIEQYFLKIRDIYFPKR